MKLFVRIFLVSLTLIGATGPALAQEVFVDIPDTPADGYPLSHAMLDDTALREWVAAAVPSIMTFDFQNHDEKLEAAKHYFTAEGWQSFSNALETAGIVGALDKNKQSLSTEFTDTIVIMGQENKNGRYEWIVKAPARMTYTNGENTKPQDVVLTLVLARTNDPENDLVGIQQWLAMPFDDDH